MALVAAREAFDISGSCVSYALVPARSSNVDPGLDTCPGDPGLDTCPGEDTMDDQSGESDCGLDVGQEEACS